MATETTSPCELCGFGGPMAPRWPRKGVVACPRCGLLFYDGSVDPSALYGASYFHGGEYHDYEGQRAVLQRTFRRRVDELARLKPGGRLLELGCAYGFFLDLARERWSVRGMDVAHDAVAHARDALGLDARAADFLELPDEPGQWDVVCLWDTVEHLAHPVRVLEKAARWLAPGGVLAATTGDAGSFVARWRGERWRLLHPPTHLYFFTAATLGRAARQAGLEVLSVTHPGQARSWRAMAHELCLARGAHRPWLYGLLTLGGRLDFPVTLNLFDIMCLVARKPCP